jgi:ferredoxin-NADP reductase
MRTLRIREVLPATPRARIVRLDLAGETFGYLPGQWIKVGAHGQPTRKAYSVACSPEDADRDGWIELLVGLDGESSGAHLVLERGAAIDVEGPFGTFTFPIDPAERRFLFIAGGTGIAPLRAMLRHALARADREAVVGVLYSARTASEFAYEAELRALAHERRIELAQTVTRDEDAAWTGARGRIGRADLAPLVHDPATLCFICGPQPLVHGTKQHLQELNVDATRIRVEEW